MFYFHFQNLSAAIFAPGWTHECKSKDVLNPTYPCREYKFWKLIRPFLFVRGPLVDEKSPIFQTYFCPGFGQNFEDESWWLNLICQDFQPSLLARPHIGELYFTIFQSYADSCVRAHNRDLGYIKKCLFFRDI